MADGTGGDVAAFEAWTVATVDVVAFVLVLVLAGHATGGLAGSLSDVGTLPGVLVFGYLWVLVLLTTRWVLDGGGLARIDEGEGSALVVRGTGGGAIVGAGFVGGLGFVFGVINLFGGAELLSLALLVLFGAVGGAVGGAVVGLVFALANVGLYRVAGTRVPGHPE